MKSLKKGSIILFLITICIIKSSAQNWQWVKKAGGPSEDNVTGICTDFFGNVYIIGDYEFIFTVVAASSISFDSITLPPNGDNQLYVAKYSSSGNILWAKSIGGNNTIGASGYNYEEPRSISYDMLNQCIYLTANIYGTVTFGSSTLSGYGVSIYTKMDLNGNFIWAKQFPYAFSSYVSISCDNQGHQILYGYTSDSLQLGTQIIPPGGFVAQFNSIGNISWAKNLTSKNPFDKIKLYNNKIYGIINLMNDSLRIDTSLYVSNTSQNILLVCLDSTGQLIWLREAKSNYSIRCFDMDIDLYGNIFLTGNFKTNADFGNSQLLNPNNSDIYIVKYDSIGILIWIRQGNCSNSVAGDFITGLNGNIYVSGSLIGNLLLDTIGINSTIAGERFVSEWTTNGNIISIQMLSISNHSQITLSYTNKFFISGDFYQNATIGSNTITSSGYQDIFIAKYDFATGIGELNKSKLNNQLYIHANPNEGKCNITIPDDFLRDKNLVLSIYSSSGKLIQQKVLEMNEGKINLSLEAEAKGLYNAVLSNGLKSYSGKIVFE